MHNLILFFQAVTGSRGQVSHCVAINSVDDFLTDDSESDIISTEGCFACQMNSRPRGGRSRFTSYRSTRTRTRNRHYQRRQRSSSTTRRRTRRHLISASFTSSQRPSKSQNNLVYFLFSMILLFQCLLPWTISSRRDWIQACLNSTQNCLLDSNLAKPSTRDPFCSLSLRKLGQN